MPVESESVLYIQAHEADIIRGPSGWNAAISLEATEVESMEPTQRGLIKWGSAMSVEEPQDAIWVERYVIYLANSSGTMTSLYLPIPVSSQPFIFCFGFMVSFMG